VQAVHPQQIRGTPVVVYRKPQCPLCEEALELLAGLAQTRALQVELRNIYADPAWFERYRYLVPVVEIAGIPRLTLRFSERDLLAALDAATPETP
jgi:glutaredoxin